MSQQQPDDKKSKPAEGIVSKLLSKGRISNAEFPKKLATVPVAPPLPSRMLQQQAASPSVLAKAIIQEQKKSSGFKPQNVPVEVLKESSKKSRVTKVSPDGSPRRQLTGLQGVNVQDRARELSKLFKSPVHSSSQLSKQSVKLIEDAIKQEVPFGPQPKPQEEQGVFATLAKNVSKALAIAPAPQEQQSVKSKKVSFVEPQEKEKEEEKEEEVVVVSEPVSASPRRSDIPSFRCPVKSDGSPDRRYKYPTFVNADGRANKKISRNSPKRLELLEDMNWEMVCSSGSSSPSMRSMGSSLRSSPELSFDCPLNADGSPDLRYKYPTFVNAKGKASSRYRANSPKRLRKLDEMKWAVSCPKSPSLDSDVEVVNSRSGSPM